MPNGLKIISKFSEPENKIPEEIAISPTHTLYHVLDSVHRKPETSLMITLRVKQPESRENVEGKPMSFLQTPMHCAMFAIAKDCLES